MSTPLEEYALIGDCETAALVSRAGSIDWLCWPSFESPACLAGLLGTKDNGRWLLAPCDSSARVSRRYRPNTLILETTFETNDGAVTLVDFMPPRDNQSSVVRIVRGDRGRVRMQMELVLRFDYGRAVPWVTKLDDGTMRGIAGPDMVVLRTPVPVQGKDLTTVATFDVEAGRSVPFVLSHGPSHLPPPVSINAEKELKETEAFWTEWSSKSKADGPWSDAVNRSLITLKALTFAPTGGIVAAPTTSLPERFGGERNWDYRFCWLRDATLTLLALMNAGYFEEAKAWKNWLLRAAAGAPAQLQIMYGITGNRWLIEAEVPWLAGYEQSVPVRTGNAAHAQLQLDVYGEVMDALHQARRGGIQTSDADWGFQRALIEQLRKVWHKPDQGMWEVRGGPQHFTFSKVMAWVALDRGIRAVESCKLEARVDEWRALRQQIHDEVCARGFNQRTGSFVQAYDSDALDASLLLIPTTGFLPASDPRVHGTIRAIKEHLFVDGFLLRYDTKKTDDGLSPGEGAFLACSFWLADALLLVGEASEAEAMFKRLLALRNDVGLLSEQYDVRSKRLAGNFPQAFSHVALINTAHNLAHAQKPAHQRSERS